MRGASLVTATGMLVFGLLFCGFIAERALWNECRAHASFLYCLYTLGK